jgi:hypothetical protein
MVENDFAVAELNYGLRIYLHGRTLIVDDCPRIPLIFNDVSHEQGDRGRGSTLVNESASAAVQDGAGGTIIGRQRHGENYQHG